MWELGTGESASPAVTSDQTRLFGVVGLQPTERERSEIWLQLSISLVFSASRLGCPQRTGTGDWMMTVY